MYDGRTNRFLGSLLGLALGDAFGAPYEGGFLERAVWAFFGTREGRRRWTDDTQMTVDVVESLVNCRRVDQDDLARRFAQSYRWSRGYGPGAARVLKRIRRGEHWKLAARAVYRDGSFGNGGAMRAPAVGLFVIFHLNGATRFRVNRATLSCHFQARTRIIISRFLPWNQPGIPLAGANDNFYHPGLRGKLRVEADPV